MPTTIPLEDLNTLGVQLQHSLHENLLHDTPLGIRCIFKEEKLIVLGQHQAGISLDPTQTLRFLERTIQALQLRVAQQVRLYLRIVGHKQPYAYRYFVIQPPPPPPNPALCRERLQQEAPQSESPQSKSPQPDDEWIVPDEELDALVQELAIHSSESGATSGSPPGGDVASSSPFSFERAGALALISSSALERLATDTQSTWNGWMNQLQGKQRVVVTTGVATLGLAGGLYALTRPCVIGTCPELQMAQDLSQQSIDRAKSARTAADLEAAHHHLGQAIALLETIPAWSGRSPDAQTLLQDYEAQTVALNTLIAAQEQATLALQGSQNPPHAVAVWQTVRSHWQAAIDQLKPIVEQPSMGAIAQQRLRTYQIHLHQAEQALQREEQAQNTLDVAQQAIQLAEERHRQAQSLADWQLTRATWQVVMMRLQAVTANTTGALKAEQWLASYEPRLAEANQRVEQEAIADQMFKQATQQAEMAQAAERRFAWQQAIASWTLAIDLIQEVPEDTAYTTQASEQVSTYKTALNQAQQKLQASAQVSSELSKVCRGEMQACQLLVVSDEIRVQLNATYVQAIETARNSGNHDLQAIVADHQLTLRRSLEGIANHFRLPVEVYDPNHQLLDRHIPQ